MVTAMILNQDFDKLQNKKSSQFCFLDDHGNIGQSLVNLFMKNANAHKSKNKRRSFVKNYLARF